MKLAELFEATETAKTLKDFATLAMKKPAAIIKLSKLFESRELPPARALIELENLAQALKRMKPPIQMIIDTRHIIGIGLTYAIREAIPAAVVDLTGYDVVDPWKIKDIKPKLTAIVHVDKISTQIEVLLREFIEEGRSIIIITDDSHAFPESILSRLTLFKFTPQAALAYHAHSHDISKDKVLYSILSKYKAGGDPTHLIQLARESGYDWPELKVIEKSIKSAGK